MLRAKRYSRDSTSLVLVYDLYYAIPRYFNKILARYKDSNFIAFEGPVQDAELMLLRAGFKRIKRFRNENYVEGRNINMWFKRGTLEAPITSTKYYFRQETWCCGIYKGVSAKVADPYPPNQAVYIWSKNRPGPTYQRLTKGLWFLPPISARS